MSRNIIIALHRLYNFNLEQWNVHNKRNFSSEDIPLERGTTGLFDVS